MPFLSMNMFTADGHKSDHLSFSVLSLGDSSYEFFCQTGKEFDERLKTWRNASFRSSGL